MKGSTFFKLLGATIIITLALFYLANLVMPMSQYTDLLGYSLVFFIVLTVFIYWLGERALQSNKGNFFIYIIMINVFVKLFASFIFVMIYAKLKDPSDKYFVATFLLTYLTFTVFETYFLSIQARSSK